MSGITQRLQFLDHTMRLFKKKVLLTTIAASAASVIILVAGSWFFLYRYYKNMVELHYSSVLQSSVMVQDMLLDENGYRENLAELTRELYRYEGVRSAWAADRYGNLVFHTDAEFLDEYGGGRLPHEFHPNLSELWVFENDRMVPVVHYPDLSRIRVSLPLYASGREQPDFVVGIDGRRFISVPGPGWLAAAMAGGYVLFAAALLFLPLHLLVGKRIRDLQSQTMVMAQTETGYEPEPAQRAAFQAEQAERQTRAEQKPGETEESAQKTTGREEGRAPDQGSTAQEQEAAKSGGQPGAEAEQEPAEAGGQPGTEAEQEPAEAGGQPGTEAEKKPAEAGSSDTDDESPGAQFAGMDQAEMFSRLREMHFAPETVDLPFIEGSSLVLHPERSDGAYVFFNGEETTHTYILFSSPSEIESVNAEMIPEIRSAMRVSIRDGLDLKHFVLRSNEFCREKKIILHLGVVQIDSENRNVSFVSCGQTYALYLKRDSEEVREFSMNIPRLGERDNDEMSETVETADIDFSAGDLLVVMPHNAQGIRLKGQLLDYTVRDTLVEMRDSGAEEITGRIMESFQNLEPDERAKLPETGLVVFRYR
jgi:hypothetical protein